VDRNITISGTQSSLFPSFFLRDWLTL